MDKRIEELTKDEIDKMVGDLHAMMWSGDGCEICAHCEVVHREPYYKTRCTLNGSCEPLWRGFKPKEG